jgi:hypothetical protein
MSVSVPFDQLVRAGSEWADQADELSAASRCLTLLDTASLGSEVSAAAARFVATWRAELDALKRDAEEHAANLLAATQTWLAMDEATAASLRELMPWQAAR